MLVYYIILKKYTFFYGSTYVNKNIILHMGLWFVSEYRLKNVIFIVTVNIKRHRGYQTMQTDHRQTGNPPIPVRGWGRHDHGHVQKDVP